MMMTDLKRTVLGHAARLLAMGLLVIAASRSFAADGDVWRLAGTFNGWNTNDAQWAMRPRGARYELEREISPGSYRFKFVKNGSWDQGHLGESPARPGALEQPGQDLILRIRHPARYKVTLDPTSRAWYFAATGAEKTIIDARIRGTAMVAAPFIVDLAGTVTIEKFDPSQMMIEFIGVPARVTTSKPGGREWTITPEGSGDGILRVTLTDAGETSVSETPIKVLPAAALRYSFKRDPNKIVRLPLQPVGEGVMRVVVRFDEETELAAMDVEGAVGESVRTRNVTVPAGVYAVEVNHGILTTQPNPEYPLMLIPGNWRVLSMKLPAGAESIHVVGDFNNWARPGAPGAIRLTEQTDGTAFTIVKLLDGANRYRYVIDGANEVLDPDPKATSPDAPGGPASIIIAGRGPAEYEKPEPNGINLEAVRHAPHSLRDFTPISSGLGLADISVSTLPNDVERVFIDVHTSTDQGGALLRIPMMRSNDAAGFDRWSARVMTRLPRVKYSFVLEDGSASSITTEHTVPVVPAFETPDWAKGAVWYQIFPERFRNGNPLNDPRGPGVYQMPWTEDWYAISTEEEAAWRKRYQIDPGAPWPARRGGNLFNVVWDRRYGGDLQGIAEKFEYLRELGVTALYMNPIFEAESMHKYDATDYRHIDDNLALPKSAGEAPEVYSFKGEPADPSTWTWSAADRYFVDEFLPAAKKAGIRVVLDGVWNHTGKPFFAFRDIEEKGDKSPYQDWYYVTFDETGKLKAWESWFNTGALPKFRQTSDGDLVPPVKEHLFNVTRRWMDPNGDGDPSDGVDGWRLDVALDVGQPFWRDWRKLVKGINPDAIIIAEIWDEADPYLRGDAYDTQMHYPFAKPVIDWLGVRPGMPSEDLAARLADAFDDAPQTNLIHQNLFGSHDTDRYVSMLQNPNRAYDEGNRPQDHDYPYKDVKPTKDIYQRSMLGVALQALYTGAPMVYYGDEVGMWGADDPTDRKPFPWPDKGQMKNPDERGDWELQKDYALWLNLRNDPKLGAILRYGAVRHLDSGDHSVFAFERSLNGQRIFAVINRQAKAWNASKLLPRNVRNPLVPAESAMYWLIEPGQER